MALEIRPARREDIGTVTAIYGHHVRYGLASFELEAPPLAEMQRRFESVIGSGYPYFVAVVADRVLGYAYASAFRTRPAYRYTVEDSVYVDPDATGRGVGRALLHALIDACTARGLRRMVAVIGDSANLASIGLHRACGFADVGVIKSAGFKHGRWVDSVLMQRALGAGDGLPPHG